MAPKNFATMLNLAKKQNAGGDSSPALSVDPQRVNTNQAVAERNRQVVAPSKPSNQNRPAETPKRKDTPIQKEPETKKSKKHNSRSSKTGSHEKRPSSHEKQTVPPLEVDFLKKAQIDFLTAPIEVCAKVMMNYAEVHQREVEAVRQRCRDERKKWVAEEKTKIEDELNKKGEELDQTKDKLKSAEESIAKLTSERNVLHSKLSKMEAEAVNVGELRQKIESYRTSELKNLKIIADLEAEVAKLKLNVPASGDLGVQLQEARKERDLAVKAAIQCYDEGFCEAVKQIGLAYPGGDFDDEIINSHNESEDDKIYHVDRQTGERSLVWRRNPNP